LSERASCASGGPSFWSIGRWSFDLQSSAKDNLCAGGANGTRCRLHDDFAGCQFFPAGHPQLATCGRDSYADFANT
jgi:hypothetical protein